MNGKGQFYIIASVFVLISLAALFIFTLFVEFSPLTLQTQTTDFENLQNSIEQQNRWLPSYWVELHWQNRTVVNITGGVTNPIQINSPIPNGYECYNNVSVINKSGSGGHNVIPSNVSANTAPCNVTFNATPGVYEIYWNCAGAYICNNPTGRGSLPSTGTVPTYNKYQESSPATVCSHFSSLLARKNIAFNCSAPLPGGQMLANTYNYSVSFRSTDFAFSGSIAPIEV